MASLVLGVVGTAVGGPFGGLIGSALGSALDSALFAPDVPNNSVEGPRLQETTVVRANPGNIIPEIYGAMRVAPTVLCSGDIIEVITTSETKNQSGGKGGSIGGGGGTTTVTTTTEYSYYIDVDFLLCKGPILGIGRIWADGNLIRGPRTTVAQVESNSIPKVGGFTYPDRFFRNAYDPELVPHSLNPFRNSAPSAERYLLAADRETFVQVLPRNVALALNNNQVVYWRDLNTGYYIPTPESHAYVARNTTGSSFRSWGHYYNLYDAINDFSPRALFGMEEVDGIQFFNGAARQDPSGVMQAVLNTPFIPAYHRKAHIVFNRMALKRFGNRIPNLKIEVIQADRITVQDVISSLMIKSGVSEENFDTSALDASNRLPYVMGYGITNQTNYRASLEQFLSAYDIDAVESGSKISFTEKQDKDFVVTIDYSELGAGGGQPSSIRRTTTYKDPSDIPDQLTLSFSDPLRDYNNNSVYYRREISDGINNTASVSYNLTMFPYYALDLASLKLQNIWLEAVSHSFSLPRKYIFLRVGSAVRIKLKNGKFLTMKIQNITKGANNVIEVAAIAYVPNNNNYLAGFGDQDFVSTGFTTTVNVGFPDAVYHFLDTPPLVSAPTDAILYTVASLPYIKQKQDTSALFRSLDDDTYVFVKDVRSLATVGEVTDGLLLPANPCTYDTVSQLTVELVGENSTLSSVSVSNLFGLFNACMVGNEVVQFKDVEFLGGQTYRLSNFIRGLRGTDRPEDMNNHAIGERFILLNTADVVGVPLPTNQLGQPYFYKMVSPGQNEEDAEGVSVKVTGRNLKPLAPCQVTATRVGTTINIQWVRRDRTYHYWIDGVDIPTSETVEAYVINVYTPNFQTLLARYSSATRNFAISGATQTALGLVPGAKMSIGIQQVSSTIGNGEEQREIV